MSELIAADSNDTRSDIVNETSIVALAEMEQGEADLSDEVRNLTAEFRRLQPLNDAAAALEMGVLTGGLLDASDQYGADKVVSALRASFSHGENASLYDTYKKLIPDTGERKRFLAGADDQESVMHAVERINEIGGTQDSSWDLSDQFERARGFDTRGLSKRKERQSGRGNTSTGFDEPHKAIGFSDAMFNQPELFESVVAEGGDIVDVIKNLRDIYASGAESYGAEHARILERVEAAVVDRQRPVRTLRELADNVLANEVRQLEATLNDIDDDSQRELLAGMLEARATEAQDKRAQFDEQLSVIRAEVLRELGAEHIETSVLAAPREPRTIEDTRSWYQNTVAS